MIRLKPFLLLALILVSGCTNSFSTGNILNLGETHGIDCVLGGNGESYMFGDTFLVHEGDKKIQIKDVSLVDADDMSLTEAVLVKMELDEAVLGFGEWPPIDSDTLPLPVDWKNRIQAEGAVIQPNEEWNLVFVLTSKASDTSSIKAVKIVYEDSEGRKYTQETLIQYFMTSRTCEEVLKENPL